MEVILVSNPEKKLIKMRITKEDSFGLIIDIQEKLIPHIDKNEELAKNTAILINGLKILDLPILMTEQYRKGLGATIPQIIELLGNSLSFEKSAFSCCDDESISGAISGLNKKYAIIAGIEAHICVLQTVIDLQESGIQTVVVYDCISSRKESDKLIAIERMQSEGAIITSYESVLFELARISGTDAFKKISKLVK